MNQLRFTLDTQYELWVIKGTTALMCNENVVDHALHPRGLQ